MPLLTEAAVTGTAVDLRTANTAAEAWCTEVNAAVHSEICAVPDERLITERDLLQPLPSLRLQIGAPSVLRKVDRLSCIRYGSARYSVPTRLIGTTVAVVVDHGAICLLEPSTGVIVAEHELVAPGGVSILDEHYDGPRPAPNRGPRPKTTVEAVLRPGRRRSGVSGRRRGDRQHPPGLGVGDPARPRCRPRHRRPGRRFAPGGGLSPIPGGRRAIHPGRRNRNPQPRPAGDALILDLPVAPTRSLDAYKITPIIADGEVIS